MPSVNSFPGTAFSSPPVPASCCHRAYVTQHRYWRRVTIQKTNTRRRRIGVGALAARSRGTHPLVPRPPQDDIKCVTLERAFPFCCRTPSVVLGCRPRTCLFRFFCRGEGAPTSTYMSRVAINERLASTNTYCKNYNSTVEYRMKVPTVRERVLEYGKCTDLVLPSALLREWGRSTLVSALIGTMHTTCVDRCCLLAYNATNSKTKHYPCVSYFPRCGSRTGT